LNFDNIFFYLSFFLAKFMGEEKPPAYPYPPPQYMPPPPQQNVAPQTAASGGAGTGAKSFFPIYDSNRFFRV
jgi:hypothetical protein